MKQNLTSPFVNKIVIILSSFFYLGFLPLIPGTFGSIAGLILFFLTQSELFFLIPLTLAVLIIGFFISGRAERLLNKKDPSCIVIDEVGGMLLSLMFLPFNIKLAVLGFFLFRILDTLKPYPAGRFQHFKGSLGIMSDDIVAGIYTNIILQIVSKLASF